MDKFDRRKEFEIFVKYMLEEYLQRTQDKYEEKEEVKFDLMDITTERDCLYSIIKYARRVMVGKGKPHDFEKIAHYAQISWTLKQRTDLKTLQKISAKEPQRSKVVEASNIPEPPKRGFVPNRSI
jgi:hypothetical protein